MKEASKISEGVIVGSALVKLMKEAGPSARGLRRTEAFLKRLKAGMAKV